MSKWQYEDDPNNPDAHPYGQSADPNSIFYRDAQGNYPNINGIGNLSRYIQSLSGDTSGSGGGFPFFGPHTPAATTPAHSSWLNPLVSTGGNLLAAYLQSNATGDAAAAQAKALADALAYEKERDAYDRALAASRYGDYTGRIAPYLATGNNAGARMAALLGLPAPPPQTYGPPPPAPLT